MQPWHAQCAGDMHLQVPQVHARALMPSACLLHAPVLLAAGCQGGGIQVGGRACRCSRAAGPAGCNQLTAGSGQWVHRGADPAGGLSARGLELLVASCPSPLSHSLMSIAPHPGMPLPGAGASADQTHASASTLQGDFGHGLSCMIMSMS